MRGVLEEGTIGIVLNSLERGVTSKSYGSPFRGLMSFLPSKSRMVR